MTSAAPNADAGTPAAAARASPRCRGRRRSSPATSGCRSGRQDTPASATSSPTTRCSSAESGPGRRRAMTSATAPRYQSVPSRGAEKRSNTAGPTSRRPRPPTSVLDHQRRHRQEVPDIRDRQALPRLPGVQPAGEDQGLLEPRPTRHELHSRQRPRITRVPRRDSRQRPSPRILPDAWPTCRWCCFCYYGCCCFFFDVFVGCQGEGDGDAV